MSSSTPLLTVDSLSSGYGKKEVIHNISLDIDKAQIVTLIGSNGAGKSTLLKAIYGINAIWGEGSVLFDEGEIGGSKSDELLEKGIVYIGQKHNTFDTLNVEENLKVAGYLYPKALLHSKIEKLYTLLPALKAYRAKKPSQLSGGQRQLVALGMGLLHEPKLILFDEPSAGLDVKNMNEVFSIIKTMKERYGISFLIVEHRVKEIAEITDRWVGLKLGEKIYDDNAIDDEHLKEIFL